VPGEHTIISKIPRERLNQIAGRKLAALAIPVRLAADKETLEGEIGFSPNKIVHPATGAPIIRARFTVVGHDHLRFVDPPLSALPPLQFYDCDKLSTLESKLALAIQKRAAALTDIASRMRAVRLEANLDPDKLAVRAIVKTVAHAFELMGGPDGLKITRVAPVGGKPFDVPPTVPALSLERFTSPQDVELFLAGKAGSFQEAAKAAAAEEAGKGPASAAGEEGPVVTTSAPRTALTLALLAQRLGPEVMVAPNASLELVQEFQFGGTRWRFVAVHEVGTTFKGRLIGPSGDRWADRFDLLRFPGAQALAQSVLTGEGAPVSPDDPTAGMRAAESIPPSLIPQPGEIWVMKVVVEQDDGQEVRYVGTDIDGRPYGAARVLKRSDFEAVFTQMSSSWGLLVQIDQIQGDGVLYRQLDSTRQPLGPPKRMALAILVANFVPETAGV
jgi:hypothetical protein